MNQIRSRRVRLFGLTFFSLISAKRITDYRTINIPFGDVSAAMPARRGHHFRVPAVVSTVVKSKTTNSVARDAIKAQFPKRLFFTQDHSKSRTVQIRNAFAKVEQRFD